MKKTIGLLRLMRPANIITAISDILAGAAIVGYVGGADDLDAIVLLVLSTVGLYGGGVVFNDVFDATLDRVERPERPIPSGLVSAQEAAWLGAMLLSAGVALAFAHRVTSGTIALSIAIAALVYDRYGKHHGVLGPLNMGLCRGLNLLLGMSFLPAGVFQNWFLAIIPVVYVAAITIISRGEVHGGKRKTGLLAGLLYLIVVLSILFVAVKGHAPYTIVFLVMLVIFIYPPLVRAIHNPVAKNIGQAVKAGVLALIVMNASWAAASGAFQLAIITVLLLPISIMLAKLFAVT